MQLILETENANINIRQKMSLEESLNEKLIANGNIELIQDPNPALPNGNNEKEKNPTKGNIIVALEENSSLCNGEQSRDEVAPIQPNETGHASTAEITDEKEHKIDTEKNTVSETICKAPGNNTNGISNHEKDNVESQSDIVREAEVNVEKEERNCDTNVCTENVKESELYDERANTVEIQKEDICKETEKEETLNTEKEKVAIDQEEEEQPANIKEHVDIEEDVKKSANSKEKIDFNEDVKANETNVDFDQDVVKPVNSEEISVEIDEKEKITINTKEEILDINQSAVERVSEVESMLDANKIAENTANNSSELESDVVISLKEDNLKNKNQDDVPTAVSSEEVPGETTQEESQLKPTAQASTIPSIDAEKLIATAMDCDEEVGASVVQNTEVTPADIASSDRVIDTPVQSILNFKKPLDVSANESKELTQTLMDCDEKSEITSNSKDLSESMMDCDEINEIREFLVNEDSKKPASDIASELSINHDVEKVLNDKTAREPSGRNENLVVVAQAVNIEQVIGTIKSNDVISVFKAKSDTDISTVHSIKENDNISSKSDEIGTSSERTAEAKIASNNTTVPETVTSQNKDKKVIDSKELDVVNKSDEIGISSERTAEAKIASNNATVTETVTSQNKDKKVIDSKELDVDEIEKIKNQSEVSAKNKTEESVKNKTEESASGVEESAKSTEESAKSLEQTSQIEKVTEKKQAAPICRLSNTLDILSDDEDDVPPPPKVDNTQINISTENTDKQCINIEDDDDIMVIDEETATKDDQVATTSEKTESDKAFDALISEKVTEPLKDSEKDKDRKDDEAVNQKESIEPTLLTTPEVVEQITKKTEKVENLKPLVPTDFFKSYKKNLADMTRDDLEEFCVLKIVESIIDRSNLNEIRTKLKTIAQNFEEYKKKAMMLTKQNRDLQVVLKSVQEEQKKAGDSPITPLKITRSVGMQVLMTDKNTRRKTIAGGPAASNVNKQVRVNQNTRALPQVSNNSPQIPVPRLVPATATNNIVMKPPTPTPVVNSGKSPAKTASSIPNGIRNTQPAAKPEKRSHNKMLTVDLTDDEPPSKVVARNAPANPVRLVPPQNLLTPRATAPANNPNSRKVYIPISAPSGQNVNVRPGQAIMLKSVPPPGPRQRSPIGPMVRIPQNAVRMGRVHPGRHPAPLPDSMKQYQPPNWKALPPAPDLKLSKVENGIVISWKIEGYQEDSYEEIASYQLYAYQETSSPPSTALWKKIGDVKALPLPMACTLTQFMAGYKYYFAVRAVDVRSRLGPFSLPGSILLLNKM